MVIASDEIGNQGIATLSFRTSNSPLRPMNLRLPSLIFACTVFFLLLPGRSIAQGSRDDYARADNLRQLLSGKVFKDRVEPQWIGEGPQFWYKLHRGKDAVRFILVDPEAGTRQEAVDHGKLAKALGEALQKEVNPHKLPLQGFKFSNDLSTAEFGAGGKRFRYQLADGVLSEVAQPKTKGNGTTVKELPKLRTARFNGQSTQITFVNKTKETIRTFWVGKKDEHTPYSKVAPGDKFDQHTYAGHVWLVTSEDRTPIGIFEATSDNGIAVIDGSWKQGKTEEKKPGQRGRPQSNRESTSPDGKWHCEIVDYNVQITDSETSATFTLSTTGTKNDAFINRISWSPDSKKMGVIQVKQADKREIHIVESAPKGQLQPKLQTFDYVKPGDSLDHPRPRLFDITTKKQIPVAEDLFPDPWRLSEFHWDNDSSQLSFLYNQRGHQIYRVVAVNGETGKASTLINEAPETFVCYSSKTFYRRLEETNEIIWMSERDGWNHLYLFDSKTGRLKNQITTGDWPVRKVDRVDSEKRQIWFQAGGLHPDQDPYHLHYARINFDGSGLVKLTTGDGTHSIEYSPDRQFLVDTYSRVDLPPVTELRRTSDGSLVTALETAEISRLKETGWQFPERFVAKGRDGATDIYGIIHKPTNFDPAKKYPVIEKIYAGPHSAHVPKSFSSNGSSMAELGFIVVQIDGMGTSHRSKAFHDVCWQDIGDAGFPDRVLWMKAAATTRPWMDLTRVGIYGGSAGGQNAMRALIAHHDFYHVAVADCGCHDNRMDKIWWNEQWMGYPIGEHYSASSNVDQAHRMKGELMLIVGEVDKNVDPASTMQVADALIKADKDFDLVVIPGAGHGAAGTSYGRRRQRDFFVRHLLGVEPRHR